MPQQREAERQAEYPFQALWQRAFFGGGMNTKLTKVYEGLERVSCISRHSCCVLRAQQRETERQSEHLSQVLLQRAFRGEM